MRPLDGNASSPHAPTGEDATASGDQDSGYVARDAGETVQREARQDLGLITDLTDIPEVRVFADRIGARTRSLRKLVVERRVNRYAFTLAEITFDADGEIEAVFGLQVKGSQFPPVAPKAATFPTARPSRLMNGASQAQA